MSCPGVFSFGFRIQELSDLLHLYVHLLFPVPIATVQKYGAPRRAAGDTAREL